MGPSAADNARSAVSVCVLGTLMNPAKTDEQTDRPFEEQTLMNRRNCVLDGVHIGATW